MILFQDKFNGLDIEQQNRLLAKMLVRKDIKFLRGNRACTDGDKTIISPPLAVDATETQKIKDFHYKTHEASHIEGGSKIKEMGKGLQHRCINTVDDIRCEVLQEGRKAGLISYRTAFYKIAIEEFGRQMFATTTKTNVDAFVHALTCLFITKVRHDQLGLPFDAPVSKDLIEVYMRFFQDLEDEAKKQVKWGDAKTLGTKLFDRIKDWVKDEKEEQKRQEKKRQEEEQRRQEEEERKQQEDNDGDESEGSEQQDQDDTEPQDGDSGSSGDDEPEDKEDADSESGDGDQGAPEDDDAGDDSAGAGSDDSEDRNGTDDSESEDSEGFSDERGSDDDTSSNAGSDKAGEAGEDEESDSADEEDGVDEAEGKSSEEEKTDSEEKEEGAGSCKGAGENESTDEKDDEKKDSDTSKDYDGADPDDSDEADGKDKKDPKLTDEEQEEVDEEVDREMDELDDAAGDMENMNDRLKDQLNEAVENDDTGPYMVDPNVKDYIHDASVGVGDVDAIKRLGIRIVGSQASKITKVFLTRSRPSTLYNRKSGTLDMRSIAGDPYDSRDEHFTQEREGSVDKAAVMFLIDNSCSMQSRMKIDKAYAVLRQLLETLSKARVPTLAAGFTGDATRVQGATARMMPITISIIKRFNAPFDMRTIHRCTRPSNMQITPDYDAVRWGAPILWQRPETKKILIVLCDGDTVVADASNNLNERAKREYPIYVQKLRGIGMHVFGFGIDADLSHIFGDDFIYVTDESMGDEIARKLMEVLSRKRTVLT